MSVVEAASPHLRDFLRFKDDDAASAVASRRSEVAGLIFDVPGSSDKQQSPLHSGAVSAPPVSRTLLDIILSEEPTVGLHKRPAEQGHHGKDKKSWKSFKDRLRLKRAGPALIETSQAPSSEFLTNKTCRSPESRQGSARFNAAVLVLTEGSTPPENSASTEYEARNNQACEVSSANSRMTPTNRASTRFGTLVPISIEPAPFSDSPEQSLQPQLSRHSSSRYTSQLNQSPQALTRSESSPISRERSMPVLGDSDTTTLAEQQPPQESTRRLSVALAEERQQSAREAAAAQDAAGAERLVRMSLMDLLEETDRQMGLEGTRYTVGEDDGEAAAAGEEEGGGGVERNCCICMVRQRGAAFIPCGHTFCRLCSRELWVSRGSCPLCNNYITEILDIF